MENMKNYEQDFVIHDISLVLLVVKLKDWIFANHDYQN